MRKIRFVIVILLAFLFVPSVKAIDCSAYKTSSDCNSQGSCSWVGNACRIKKCNLLGVSDCQKNTNIAKQACKIVNGNKCCPNGNCNESTETVVSSGKNYDDGATGTKSMCKAFGNKTTSLIRFALNALRIGAVILVVFLGALDFFKILVDGEDKTYKDALQTFIKRLVAVVALIFAPYVIVFILKISHILSEHDISNSGIFCFFNF